MKVLYLLTDFWYNTAKLDPCFPFYLSNRMKKMDPVKFGCIVPSDFIWDSGKLPFPTHLGKYFIKIGKIRAKIHEIGKIKAIFGLGMTPIYGLKNG